MTDDKDEKSNAPQAPAKRPFATIDLKATEVIIAKSPAEAVAATAAAAKDAANAALATAAADAVKTAAATGAASATAVPSAGKAGGPAAGETKSAAGDAGNRPAAKPAGTSAAAASAANSTGNRTPGSRRGGYVSHLVAGIAGGALAFAGTQALGPLGLGDTATAPPDVTRRLAALEQAQGPRTGAAEFAQSIAGTSTRLGKLEDAARALGEAQVQLAGETKVLDDKITKSSGGQDFPGRLAKMEDQIAIMTAAANADPRNAGRLPQLAQITGKLGDLETALATRTAAIRKEMSQELEQRLAATGEQAETARARLGQRTQGLEQSMKSVADDMLALRTAVDGLKGDLDTRLKATAKPADVQAALAPVAQKIAAVEQSLQGVVRSEQDRNATAGNILLSLELANLKRALDRGGRYVSELAAVRKLAGDKLNLAVLERAQEAGVPSIAGLQQELRGLANIMLDAEAETADATLGDRLLASVKSIVRVRKTAHNPDDKSSEAVIGRMEAALRQGRLSDVLDEAKKLPPKVAVRADDWLRRLEGRHGVERALADLEASLKTSLAGGAEPKKGAN